MKIVNITSDQLEEVFEDETNAIEEDTEVRSEIFGGDDFVLLTGNAYRVTDRDLIYAEGVYCAYSEYTDAHEPDWDFVLIYSNVDDDEFNPNEFVYFEQGTPSAAIHNYCRILG